MKPDRKQRNSPKISNLNIEMCLPFAVISVYLNNAKFN